MKKLISLALALCMVLALGVTALAADSDTWATGGTSSSVTAVSGDDFSKSETIDVPGYYVDAFSSLTGEEATANYVVVLEWNVTSNLTYTITNSDYAWTVYDSDEKVSTAADFDSPAKAGYVGGGHWSGTASIGVTVTNWSNRALNATFAYADKAASGNDGIEKDIDTTNARTWTDSSLVSNTNTGGGITTWTANSGDTNGGVLALANPATGVAIRDTADAANKTAGTVTLAINALDSSNNEQMSGDISKSDIAIGTLTVTIANPAA